LDFDKVHQSLDEATDGAVYACAHVCRENGWKPRGFVQTHLDGLPHGQMRLILYGIDPQSDAIKYFDTARLEGEAQTTGWNLKLYELTSGVRRGLRRIRAGLDEIEVNA